MKLLVIGSKGFIGTHMYNYLNAAGHTVYGCDVLVDYNDPNYYQVDATNATYDELFATRDLDGCINCSGAASVPDSLVHPLRDFHLNANNVYLILDAIRRHRPKCRFINLSSAAIYGNPQTLPVRENFLINPISPYGWHKHYSEQICKEFVEFYKLDTCSVRIFSAYGPGLKKQLFWDLFKKSQVQNTISLFGTGNESRDFIYINDIVEGIHTVLMRGVFDGRCYNLASGVETTIKEAATEFFNALEFQGKVEFKMNVRAGDPMNWRADIETIRELGFAPRFTLRDGIRKYIKWLHEIA